MKNYKGNRVAYVDKNFWYNQTHEKKIFEFYYIIEDFYSSMWHIAEFKTLDQLKWFANKLGFDFTFDGKEGRCSKIISDKILGVADADNKKPRNAKYLWSLSNGHIVKNWFISDKNTISIHRINPNNERYYTLLSLEEQTDFTKKNGSY